MSRRVIVRSISCLGLVGALVLGDAGTALAAEAPARSVEELSTQLLGWLHDPDPLAAAAVVERVHQGVPPGVLLALLDAYRAAPRAELDALVRELTGYRRAEVRVRAVAAWAEQGAAAAESAVAFAAADVDIAVRRLAVSLATLHPSARADACVQELLARDAELAAELAQPPALWVEDPS
ncbi:MAG: hypothetical protein IPH07_06135 [Deltaproteobacteria bacterium]|nr:hypothetical protein [Deltaproteobacteria bacterium]MBK8719983.1 hypothetical protein [Deltaproteobacteria bacterium]MBP7290934.1 hypothetical protein [Nannocystaceae bacterium]